MYTDKILQALLEDTSQSNSQCTPGVDNQAPQAMVCIGNSDDETNANNYYDINGNKITGTDDAQYDINGNRVAVTNQPIQEDVTQASVSTHAGTVEFTNDPNKNVQAIGTTAKVASSPIQPSRVGELAGVANARPIMQEDATQVYVQDPLKHERDAKGFAPYTNQEPDSVDTLELDKNNQRNIITEDVTQASVSTDAGTVEFTNDPSKNIQAIGTTTKVASNATQQPERVGELPGVANAKPIMHEDVTESNQPDRVNSVLSNRGIIADPGRESSSDASTVVGNDATINLSQSRLPGDSTVDLSRTPNSTTEEAIMKMNECCNSLIGSLQEASCQADDELIGLIQEGAIGDTFSKVKDKVRDLKVTFKNMMARQAADKAKQREKAAENEKILNEYIDKARGTVPVIIHAGATKVFKPVVPKLPFTALLPYITNHIQNKQSVTRSGDRIAALAHSMKLPVNSESMSASEFKKVLYDTYLGEKIKSAPSESVLINNITKCSKILHQLDNYYMTIVTSDYNKLLDKMENIASGKESEAAKLYVTEVKMYTNNIMATYKYLYDIALTISNESIAAIKRATNAKDN